MTIVGNKDKKNPVEVPVTPSETVPLMDDRSKEEKKEDDNTEDLYSMKNFSL